MIQTHLFFNIMDKNLHFFLLILFILVYKYVAQIFKLESYSCQHPAYGKDFNGNFWLFLFINCNISISHV